MRVRRVTKVPKKTAAERRRARLGQGALRRSQARRGRAQPSCTSRPKNRSTIAWANGTYERQYLQGGRAGGRAMGAPALPHICSSWPMAGAAVLPKARRHAILQPPASRTPSPSLHSLLHTGSTAHSARPISFAPPSPTHSFVPMASARPARPHQMSARNWMMMNTRQRMTECSFQAETSVSTMEAR